MDEIYLIDRLYLKGKQYLIVLRYCLYRCLIEE